MPPPVTRSLWLVFQLFLPGNRTRGHGLWRFSEAAGGTGAFLGWQMLPLVILLSSLIGAIVGIGLIVFWRDRQIPSVRPPHLAAAVSSPCCGEQINRGYPAAGGAGLNLLTIGLTGGIGSGKTTASDGSHAWARTSRTDLLDRRAGRTGTTGTAEIVADSGHRCSTAPGTSTAFACASGFSLTAGASAARRYPAPEDPRRCSNVPHDRRHPTSYS